MAYGGPDTGNKEINKAKLQFIKVLHFQKQAQGLFRASFLFDSVEKWFSITDNGIRKN